MAMWLSLKQWFKNHNYAWKFKLVVCTPLLSFLILFDWISKWVVVGVMDQGESAAFIPGFLGFHYTINPGAAYGMNSGNPALAISLATVVTLFLIIGFILVNDRKWLIALSFLLAGSFANLLARAWAPIEAGTGTAGGVVDFLQWQFKFLNSDSYIFNLADVWVILGIICLGIVLIIEIVILFKPQNTKKKKKTATRKDHDE